MNAMLEARIVAARIQRPWDLEQEATNFVERITPSSHGCLMMLAIDYSEESADYTDYTDTRLENKRRGDTG
jgi:hypothetical protein